jgi:hypothetical protein
LNVISDDEDVHDNDLEQDNFYPRSTWPIRKGV